MHVLRDQRFICAATDRSVWEAPSPRSPIEEGYEAQYLTAMGRRRSPERGHHSQGRSLLQEDPSRWHE